MTKNSNIDILPMACVGLLLVIMMIMTAPMVLSHNNVPVTVPQTHTAERKTEEDVVISMTKDGALFVNDQSVNREDLAKKIGEFIAKDQYSLVVVRADKDAFHRDVLDLLAVAKQAGAVRIACATKKRKD